MNRGKARLLASLVPAVLASAVSLSPPASAVSLSPSASAVSLSAPASAAGLSAPAPVAHAGPVTSASSTSATGASGDRALVKASQLRQQPFRSIVLVAVGERVVCTGFVVAPRKVMTAGHCLARDATRGDFRFRHDLPGSVRLLRGFSQITGGSRYETCGVIRAWAPQQFIRSTARDTLFGSRAHDYAVLRTAPDCVYPQDAALRLWPTTTSDGELPAGSGIKLGGYPADSRFADMNGLNLWRSHGEVKPAGNDPRLIDTTGFVAQGMSGGPIWRSFGVDSPCGGSQCVVGILTECAVNSRGQCKLRDSLRRAVRITPEVKESIDRR